MISNRLASTVCAGILASLLVLVSACEKPGEAPPAGEAKSARADIVGKADSKLEGSVTFTEVEGGVKIVVDLKGAPPGDHGCHVHEKADCSAADFKTSGGHFNPDSKNHGRPTDAEHHAGDLGNITVKADGTGRLELTSKDLTVKDGTHSVIGKGIIIHEKADDFGQPTGNAGARIGCGEIK